VVVTHDPTAIAGRVRRVAVIDRGLTWLSPAEIEHLHCHHHLPTPGAAGRGAQR
jgi:hypothetical protein